MILPVLLPLLLGAGYETESLNIRLHGVENVTATGSTTARSLKDRFADALSVKDFGATGDGVTDDTAAIRAALLAVPSTGGEVYVPPGTYLISGGLRPKAGTTFRGSGRGSHLKMVAGGWDSYAEDSEYADNLGLIAILRSDVRVTGLRISGTLSPVVTIPGQPEYRFDPQLLTVGGLVTNPVTRVTVDHCWFEDNAWNGVWTTGTHAYTTHLAFTDNHFENIGRFVDYGGNADRVALQLNSQHVVASRNRFHRCGNAISATSSFLAVVDNVIKDCWQGVLFGDTPSLTGVVIANNEISAKIVDGSDWATPDSVLGIYGNAGGEPFGHDTQVIGNAISFVLAGTDVKKVFGIVTDGVDTVIKDNQISFDVESAWSTGSTNYAIGISLQANGNTGTSVRLSGNTVSAFSMSGLSFTDGRAIGMQTQMGAGRTLTIHSSGNRVKGFETGSTSAVSWTGGTGNVTMYVNGDIITGGAALYGSTYLGATHYNIPINLAHDTALGALTPVVTPLNPSPLVLEPTFAATIAVDATKADHVIVRGSSADAFTISNPTSGVRGKVLRFTITNQTGAPLGTLTWGAAFHLAGGSWTQPAAGYQRTVTYYFDGLSWFETGRTTSDVPN